MKNLSIIEKKALLKKQLISKANKEFLIILTPTIKQNKDTVMKPKLIGAGTLYKKLGATNANKAITDALNSKTDKYTKKFRSGFKINFYTK